MTVSGVRLYRGLVFEGVEEWETAHVITNKAIISPERSSLK